MATKYKANNNKNLKALFSVICLCIVALGLIVYFSTQTKTSNVNEATTVAESKTTQVQNRVTVKESTTQKETTQQATNTTNSTTKKVTTTQALSMSSSDTNVPYKSFYKYPCDETVIKGYSEELVKNDTMGDYRSHTAVDFKCSQGDKIVAINDGLVMSVEKDNLLGKVITIDHGSKLVVSYCGVDTVNVSVGDYVTIGQQLGTLGAVPFEASDESHLHLEAKLNGKNVNPLDVMGKTE